jgi:hypothetical protein
MTTNKHNRRKSYEQLYLRLCNELDLPPKQQQKMPDCTLLLNINEMIIKLDCTPLTQDELEMELM